MRKIQCENLVCGASFWFNEEKNPNATKVRCPKCKGVQVLKSIPQEEEENYDWLRRDPAPAAASPELPSVEETPQPDVDQKNSARENFFTEKPERSAPPPSIGGKVENTNQSSQIEIGWLVVHDEYTATVTFNLRRGINRIGRKSGSTPKDVNIAIKTNDNYMSREHCEIEVAWNQNKKNYAYALSDRRSANGTFVNAGRRLLQSDVIFLKDSDTIQVGRTKLILKLPTSVKSSRDAEDWVKRSDYSPTIIE